MLEYARILADAAASSGKPFYLMGTRAGIFRTAAHDFLRTHGIAVIGGTRQGLRAIDRLARHLTLRAPARPAPPPPPVTVSALTAERTRRTIHEHDAKRILAAAGLPVVRETLVTGRDEALAAAAAIGYPVVLKLVADEVPHRSDLGLVATELRDGADLQAAWDRIAAVRARRLPDVRVDGFLVLAMVSGGVEVLAGAHRDPDFGSFLAFGAGGIAAEVLDDVAFRPLPLRAGDAEALVTETLAARLLAGVRGQPAADVAALCRTLEALADYAGADRDALAGIDLNPITVLPRGHGCVIVDALIIPAGTAAPA